MQEVRIDRLSLGLRGLIFHGMKNREFTYPTLDELYAIEQRARRMRAAEMGRVLRTLVASLKTALARAGETHAPLRSASKEVRHA